MVSPFGTYYEAEGSRMGRRWAEEGRQVLIRMMVLLQSDTESDTLEHATNKEYVLFLMKTVKQHKFT